MRKYEIKGKWSAAWNWNVKIETKKEVGVGGDIWLWSVMFHFPLVDRLFFLKKKIHSMCVFLILPHCLHAIQVVFNYLSNLNI